MTFISRWSSSLNFVFLFCHVCRDSKNVNSFSVDQLTDKTKKICNFSLIFLLLSYFSLNWIVRFFSLNSGLFWRIVYLLLIVSELFSTTCSKYDCNLDFIIRNRWAKVFYRSNSFLFIEDRLKILTKEFSWLRCNVKVK